MTKNSKSAATIRRRRKRPLLAEFLSQVRKSPLNKRHQANDKPETEEEVFFYKEVLRSSVLKKIMSSDKTIFLALLVIRLVNAMLIQTSFVPDEFWQSVEVAHKMIFDYGYVTWEWKVGIRSYAYPLLFAAYYKVLGVLGLDNRILLIRGPRLLQGVLASVGDLYLYFLSRRLAGRDVAQWALLCQLLSWFTGYCCTRTLSNSMETVLVTAALFYFPWPGTPQPKSYNRRFVLLAALSVVVRPTAAVIWILLCSWHLQQSKGTALFSVLKLYITTGLTVLGVSTVIDRIWYGDWVFVHLNFLQFNVLSGGSEFYGRHPWHWYVTQGLPVILGPHVLPFIAGAWLAKNKVLLLLLVWKVFVLSFLAHKEFRFLLPVLPLAMHYCGVYFHTAMRPPPPPPQPKKKTLKKQAKMANKSKALSAIDEAKEEEEGEEGGDENVSSAEVDDDVKKSEKKAEAGTEDVDADSGKTSAAEKEDGKSEVAKSNSLERKTDKQEQAKKASEANAQANKPEMEHKANKQEQAKKPETSTQAKKHSETTQDTKKHSEASTPEINGAANEPGKGDEEKEGQEEDASDEASESTESAPTAEQEKASEEQKLKDGKWRARKVRLLMLLLAASNLFPLLYFCLIHQRGTVDVMNFLHDSAVRGIQKTPSGKHGASSTSSFSSSSSSSKVHQAMNSDILFLMPCHSTPYYSYLHSNVSMRFLTCEPNLEHAANYTDEADVFYLNPADWLKVEYQQNAAKKLPTHVVYFNVLEESIVEFLALGGYRLCAKFFHTHLPEGRVGSQVLVSCR